MLYNVGRIPMSPIRSTETEKKPYGCWLLTFVAAAVIILSREQNICKITNASHLTVRWPTKNVFLTCCTLFVTENCLNNFSKNSVIRFQNIPWKFNISNNNCNQVVFNVEYFYPDLIWIVRKILIVNLDIFIWRH